MSISSSAGGPGDGPRGVGRVTAMLAATIAAACCVALAACDITITQGSNAGDGATATADPGLPPASAAADLAALTVAASRPMRGYSRDRFPHWKGQGEGCDTRDVVLKRDGSGVRATSDCKITSGRWNSPYDKATVTDPGKLDIDHIVPLANAWRSGADEWNDTKRSAFANDLTRPQLIAVTASTNRAKGDQDPSQWRPGNTDYWCEYAERWITVKRHWQLTVTEAEHTKLAEMLETCT